MRNLWGYREQGRLHPADLELICMTVCEAVRKELGEFMSQLSDLMDGLTALTSDVASEMSAHATEVADLHSKLQAAQDALANNQSVDLGPAIQQVSALRANFEATAASAAQASDAAQSASAAVPDATQPAPDVTASSDQSASSGDGSAPQPEADGSVSG